MNRLMTEAEFSSEVTEIAKEHQAMYPSVLALKVWALVKERDVKTASIKDAECHARVERIFEEFETHRIPKRYSNRPVELFRFFTEEWQATKEQEGV